MEIGLCLAALGGLPLERALACAARLGVDRVDLPTDSTLGLVDPARLNDPTYLDEIAALVDRGGAPVGCVSNSRDAQLLLGPHGRHTDPVLTGPAPAKRAHALRCALGTLQLARRLGAPAVRLLPGCPDLARWLSWWGSDVAWSDNVAELFEHAAPVFDAAATAGVDVLLETHPKQVVYDRPSADLVLAAADAAGLGEVVGICVDPANLAATGHDPVAAVTGWSTRMGAVHAKDLQRWSGRDLPPGAGWSRYGPQPPIRFRALGLGELDWARIVGTLLDEGYHGVLYAEHEDALLPREQGLRRSVGALRELLPSGTPEGRTW
ncbi:MAG: sugar phosphate isomerase/epimerase [Dactylosporangium sp.]|nr:sugar phosphate isomerase/epimerase [Dactylosporangium sp.]